MANEPKVCPGSGDDDDVNVDVDVDVDVAVISKNQIDKLRVFGCSRRHQTAAGTRAAVTHCASVPCAVFRVPCTHIWE